MYRSKCDVRRRIPSQAYGSACVTCFRAPHTSITTIHHRMHSICRLVWMNACWLSTYTETLNCTPVHEDAHNNTSYTDVKSIHPSTQRCVLVEKRSWSCVSLNIIMMHAFAYVLHKIFWRSISRDQQKFQSASETENAQMQFDCRIGKEEQQYFDEDDMCLRRLGLGCMHEYKHIHVSLFVYAQPLTDLPPCTLTLFHSFSHSLSISLSLSPMCVVNIVMALLPA